MNLQVFDELRDIVYAQSGIRLQDGRENMVSARLARRLRHLGLESEEAYLEYLKQELEGEVVELLDAISTNVTHFFREPAHFDFYKEYLGQLLDEGQRRLRIWCAASSTGEEPYTLAMVLSELVRQRRATVDARILATDISTRVLEQAVAGVYSRDKVEPIPEPMKKRYFDSRGPAGDYAVKSCLKDILVFKRLNLSTPPFPMPGPLDVIFCRNVMIYFDTPVRDALVDEFTRLLSPGGYLIVGHSESLLRSGHQLERIGPSVYRRRD